MDALFTVDNAIALATLALLEIVLGIDNIVFISILSESRLEGAQLYLARVRARMASDPILGSSGITVSCGVSRFDPAEMRTGADLIQSADDHLSPSSRPAIDAPADRPSA